LLDRDRSVLFHLPIRNILPGEILEGMYDFAYLPGKLDFTAATQQKKARKEGIEAKYFNF
jgi:hypothetical protein